MIACSGAGCSAPAAVEACCVACDAAYLPRLCVPCRDALRSRREFPVSCIRCGESGPLFRLVYWVGLEAVA